MNFQYIDCAEKFNSTGEVQEWFQPKADAPSAQNWRANMYFVYVLWSDTLQKRYIGSCQNVSVRLQQHNSGGSKFTKGGIPWKIIHSEIYTTNTEARKRELFLKSGVGRQWLDEKIKSK